MGDEAPLQAPPQRDPERPGRLPEAPDAGVDAHPLELEVRLASVEREARREIPVRAGRLHDHRLRLRVDGIEAEVDEREGDVGPLVVLSFRRAAAGIPVGGWPRFGPVLERVERGELGDLLGAAVRARHAVHRPDLRDVLTPHVRHDTVLRREVGQPDRLGDLPEQVHDRRAVETERLGVDAALEGKFLLEVEEHFERLPEVVPGSSVEPDEVHEEELLGEREILLEEPVPEERPFREGEEPFVPGEPHGLDGARRETHRRGSVPRAARPQLHRRDVQVEVLVEGVDDLPLPGEIEAQPVERPLLELRDLLPQVAERNPAEGLQLQPENGPDVLVRTDPRDRELEPGRPDLQRPEANGIPRPEPARRSSHRARGERGPLGDRVPRLQVDLARVEDELDDRHRRDRRQEVRVEDVEERLRDLGVLVVDLEPDPARQEGERLDEPLDVRVVALVGLEGEPPGDLRVGLRELRPQPADEAQLALVVAEELVAHQSPFTLNSPVPSWRNVS